MVGGVEENAMGFLEQKTTPPQNQKFQKRQACVNKVYKSPKNHRKQWEEKIF